MDSFQFAQHNTLALRDREVDRVVDNLFCASGILTVDSPGAAKFVDVPTKAGWCLRKGMTQLYSAKNSCLALLVDRHGLPGFYSCLKQSQLPRHDATQDIKDPSTCFESLCRIILGQFVSGAAAQAVWKRLLRTTGNVVTPKKILELVHENCNTFENIAWTSFIENGLQKPAGITRAKALSIVDLARHFESGKLRDNFLESASEEDVRKALLQIRGIGPWSCDMFLIFYLERPNILPLGDLGVRKGLALQFGIKGSGVKREICPKKDSERMRELLKDFEPYLSLLSYYMWRVVDTPDSVKNSVASNTIAAKDISNTVHELPRKRRRVASKKITF